MSGGPRNPHALDQVLPGAAKDALRHLEIVARRLVDGMQHGIHRSRRIGVSTEFDHHKQYQPGDPLKHIDWKLSARHDEYYVKRYLEDTSLTTWLVVDHSASMRQATEGLPSKYDRAAQAAASLAYLILKQKDSVGMVMANGEKTAWLQTSGTERHLVRILESLVERPPEGVDDMERTLRAIVDRGARRGLIVVLTDLMYPPEPVQKQLASLQARGHEVLLFQFRDQTEEEFPFNRWVEFRDLENAATRRRLDAVPLRRIYLEEYQALMEEWRTWARKYDIHLVSMRAEEHVETVLSNYLAQRGGMMKQ